MEKKFILNLPPNDSDQNLFSQTRLIRGYNGSCTCGTNNLFFPKIDQAETYMEYHLSVHENIQGVTKHTVSVSPGFFEKSISPVDSGAPIQATGENTYNLFESSRYPDFESEGAVR